MNVFNNKMSFSFLTKIFLLFIIGFCAFLITIQFIPLNKDSFDIKESDHPEPKQNANTLIPQKNINEEIEQKIIGDSKKGELGEYILWEDRDPINPKSVNYAIYYYKDQKEVVIDILRSPFPEWREKAEKTFLEKTNLTEKEACELNVNLGTIRSVDFELSGKNLGLSFCKKSPQD